MGLISDMFPEFSSTVDKYFSEGGQLFEKPTTALLRGMSISGTGTGMIDLFSMPEVLIEG